VTEFRKPWLAICEAAQIDDVRIHDLRRTLGSYQAIAGTSEVIIGATLGHRDSKSTRVYSRLTLDPVRDAMNNAVALMGIDRNEVGDE